MSLTKCCWKYRLQIAVHFFPAWMWYTELKQKRHGWVCTIYSRYTPSSHLIYVRFRWDTLAAQQSAWKVVFTISSADFLFLSTMGLFPDTKTCGLRMHRECQEHFPHHRGLAIPTCITARASRTCRDAYRDLWLAVSFEVGGGENVPGILGACATRKFTHLVRGPWSGHMTITDITTYFS